MLLNLWNHISRRRQNQFYLILVLMTLASLTEVISIGLVIPFLGAITAPEIVYEYELLQPLIIFLGIDSANELILPLTIGFSCSALLAGGIRLLLLYTMTRFSFAVGADLSIDIYLRTLYQSYAVHVSRNSSEVINGIITKTNTVIGGVISPVLTLISSVVIILAISLALFSIDFKIASISMISFGLIYLVVILYTKKQLYQNSKTIADNSTMMIKSLQEGLGGIRDVLIDGSQEFYAKLYRQADLPLRYASGNNQFINRSPRYVIESISMALIALLAFYLSKTSTNLLDVIPLLGALALGAQRLLPALQQAYGSYASISGVRESFNDVLELLDQPLPIYSSNKIIEPILFEKAIDINDVNFRYSSDSPYILKNINLLIKKGSRVGLIGKTGSGKSTLFDILMGLLLPTEGNISVDKLPIDVNNVRNWQAHIAHVPQVVFLSDSSIEQNIAFGVAIDEIDKELVRAAAKKAQLSVLIDEWKDGYDTIVGERGVRLSGGQRQRIGIARSLYKNASVLIFDEATSSLDNQTENAVMEAIRDLDKDLTILIIAHRISTLRDCDEIIELSDEGLMIKKYEEIKGYDN
jgi:ATP-binding cassette, subfamily B, bacterial PglK